MYQLWKNNSRFLIAAGLLALVVLGATACSTPVAAPAGGSNQPENVIAVNGSGEASAAPDVAYVDLGIQLTGPDLDTVLSEANDTAAAIKDAVIGAGVEEKDVQTTSFNVNTETRYDDQGQPTGQPIYHVDNVIRITVHAIDTTGDIIGAGLDAGANSVRNLSFGIEDTSALEAEARQQAIADAQDRASQLADALGVKVGPPVQVSESFSGPPAPVQRAAAFDMAAAESAPSISQGELTVTVNVSVQFRIEQ